VGDIPVDGNTRVAWVPAISNKAVPTTSELNAGILLQNIITADGLIGFRPETATVPTTSLASKFDTGRTGRVSYSGTMLRLKKQDGTDTAWNTLVFRANGYIVVRRRIDEATAWTTSQKVSVYPVECGETADVDPEANTVDRYEVQLVMTSAPELRATVA
jgi:hypothetical protein